MRYIRAINRRAVINHEFSCQSIYTGVSRYISALIRRGMPHFTPIIRFAFGSDTRAAGMREPPRGATVIGAGSVPVGGGGARGPRLPAPGRAQNGIRYDNDELLTPVSRSSSINLGRVDLTHDSICQRQSRPTAARSVGRSVRLYQLAAVVDLDQNSAPNERYERVCLCL